MKISNLTIILFESGVLLNAVKLLKYELSLHSNQFLRKSLNLERNLLASSKASSTDDEEDRRSGQIEV